MILGLLFAGLVIGGQIGAFNGLMTPRSLNEMRTTTALDKLLPNFEWEGPAILNVVIILLNIYLLGLSKFQRILVIIPALIIPFMQEKTLPFAYTHQILLLFGIWTENYLVVIISLLKLLYDSWTDTFLTSNRELFLYNIRVCISLNVLPFLYFFWMDQLKIEQLIFFILLYWLQNTIQTFAMTGLNLDDLDGPWGYRTWDPISQIWTMVRYTTPWQHSLAAGAALNEADLMRAEQEQEWTDYDLREKNPDRRKEARYQGYKAWKAREDSRSWRNQIFKYPRKRGEEDKPQTEYERRHFAAIVRRHDEAREGWLEYWDTEGRLRGIQTPPRGRIGDLEII